MKPKELKRLSRNDLLEIMLDLSKENEELRKENELLRKQLHDRNISIEECGSLAEAALRLNGVFQAAQKACDQYTENIHTRSAELELRCRQMENAAEERCRKMEQEAKEACDALLAQAKEQARACLEEAKKQREAQNQEYLWLTELMNGGEKG